MDYEEKRKEEAISLGYTNMSEFCRDICIIKRELRKKRIQYTKEASLQELRQLNSSTLRTLQPTPPNKPYSVEQVKP